jgi:hypothetical protein
LGSIECDFVSLDLLDEERGACACILQVSFPLGWEVVSQRMMINDPHACLGRNALERDHGLRIDKEDLADRFLRELAELGEPQLAAIIMQVCCPIAIDLTRQHSVSIRIEQMGTQK